MQKTWKPLSVAWIALSLLPLAGCNRGGDGSQPTPAAVNGPDGESAAATQEASAALPSPPKPEQDAAHPVVVIGTSLGSFTVRLDGDKVPMTVDNFLTYVGNHHYDQTIFHQVLKEHPKVILGGAFTPQMAEKKTRSPIYNEAPTGRKNLRGTIGMARQPDSIHSATCHFYVNLTDNAQLDHQNRTVEGYGYCVFGEVIEGMSVVDQIGQVPIHDTDKFERLPVQTVAIKSVKRIK